MSLSTLRQVGPAPAGFKSIHHAQVFAQAAVDYDDHRERDFLSEDLATRSRFAVHVSGDAELIVAAALPLEERRAIVCAHRAAHIIKARGESHALDGYLLALADEERAPILGGMVPLHEVDRCAASWMEALRAKVVRVRNHAKDTMRATLQRQIIDLGPGMDGRNVVPRWIVVTESGKMGLFMSRAEARAWGERDGGMSWLSPLGGEHAKFEYLNDNQVSARVHALNLAEAAQVEAAPADASAPADPAAPADDKAAPPWKSGPIAPAAISGEAARAFQASTGRAKRGITGGIEEISG